MSNTETVKRINGKKQRGHAVELSDDANKNSKVWAEYALETIRKGFTQLSQIANGKKVRNVGTKENPVKKEFPLEKMSDARRKYFEDEIASIFEHTFSILETGRKSTVASKNVPD